MVFKYDFSAPFTSPMQIYAVLLLSLFYYIVFSIVLYYRCYRENFFITDSRISGDTRFLDNIMSFYK